MSRSISGPSLEGLAVYDAQRVDPAPDARLRQLEYELKELKCRLAEEMLSRATAEQETRFLRERLTSSEEALIQFAERARSDREQAAATRKRPSPPPHIGVK